MSARIVPPTDAMSMKSLGWFLVALALACALAAHLGIGSAGRLAAILVTLALALAVAGRANGRFRALRVALALAGGAALVIALLLGHARSLPLLLPPVLMPLLLGWTFGRTLLRGRTPFVERIACVVHDVPDLGPEMSRYTRAVTLLWTAFFATVVLVNAVLLFVAVPGGLLDLAGVATPWAVPLATCTWIGGTITGLATLALFVAEYAVRLVRFPDYRFRDPVGLARRVRARWPAIAASWRDE